MAERSGNVFTIRQPDIIPLFALEKRILALLNKIPRWRSNEGGFIPPTEIKETVGEHTRSALNLAESLFMKFPDFTNVMNHRLVYGMLIIHDMGQTRNEVKHALINIHAPFGSIDIYDSFEDWEKDNSFYPLEATTAQLADKLATHRTHAQHKFAQPPASEGSIDGFFREDPYLSKVFDRLKRVWELHPDRTSVCEIASLVAQWMTDDLNALSFEDRQTAATVITQRLALELPELIDHGQSHDVRFYPQVARVC